MLNVYFIHYYINLIVRVVVCFWARKHACCPENIRTQPSIALKTYVYVYSITYSPAHTIIYTYMWTLLHHSTTHSCSFYLTLSKSLNSNGSQTNKQASKQQQQTSKHRQRNKFIIIKFEFWPNSKGKHECIIKYVQIKHCNNFERFQYWMEMIEREREAVGGSQKEGKGGGGGRERSSSLSDNIQYKIYIYIHIIIILLLLYSTFVCDGIGKVSNLCVWYGIARRI